MNRLALAAALAASLSLGACAGVTARQTAEKADLDASLLYASIATLANAYEAHQGADIARAEAIKVKAWKALKVERDAYALGLTADLSALAAIAAEAKALGN